MKITEDYVSYEVAKLLKEKGFHEPCIATYNLTTKDFAVEEVYQDWTTCWKTYVSAPTLQMACKWLREVYNIHIIVKPYTDKEGNNWLFIFDKYAYGCWQELSIYITEFWNSYEEAVEAAIKYVLENLI